ncbi:MAG: circularly permuted type 2 ATP-grasp protein [Chloroherpetonaceae bacterium]|nr:circularly permuted type 2 ATP-grasp protein [Chloroherpetonaceae bacterium]
MNDRFENNFRGGFDLTRYNEVLVKQPEIEQPDASTPYDEMFLGGRFNDVWQPFLSSINQIGIEELRRRTVELRHLLHETGITYNIYGDPQGLERIWKLDLFPLILSDSDWEIIEKGMKQRATLLNMILKDLYSDRELIKKGLIPPELIYSHDGFFRNAIFQFPTKISDLHIYAADMARGPDGRMWVIADRTQAPSGIGYALENRRLIARVLPEAAKALQISKLNEFVKHLSSSIASLSIKENPRIALLTPGPRNETYFEHAFLASLLGYPLVQGEDLTVRAGELWLKSLSGLEKVDIVLRRVDDSFCDPLELYEHSKLGVPGMLECIRRGNLSVANPIGVGILENPGLLAFLPTLSKALLNEELILPSAATWWCGGQRELEFVLTNIPRLIIKSIHQSKNGEVYFGQGLDKKSIEELKAKILSHPHLYVGQEQISFSTAPSFTVEHLEPRRTVLRAFGVKSGDSYSIMPGGLTRASSTRDTISVSNQVGGVGKDTWVIGKRAQENVKADDSQSVVYKGVSTIDKDIFSLSKRETLETTVLASRAGENLYWAGRYAERAESLATLLQHILTILNEENRNTRQTDSLAFQELLKTLTHLTCIYPGFVGEEAEIKLRNPESELLRITIGKGIEGSLPSTLEHFINASYAVRSYWSLETWKILNSIKTRWSGIDNFSRMNLRLVQIELQELLVSLLALKGLNGENMQREYDWVMLDSGRRIERALQNAMLLRYLFSDVHQIEVEESKMEAALTLQGSLVAYKRKFRSVLSLEIIFDLLIIDEKNPRSILFQISELVQHLKSLPFVNADSKFKDIDSLLLRLFTELRSINSKKLIETEFSNWRGSFWEFILSIEKNIRELSDALSRNYFTHTPLLQKQLTDINEAIIDFPTQMNELGSQ